MPNFEELLRHAMVARSVRDTRGFKAEPLPGPKRPAKAVTEEEARTLAVWDWKPAEGSPGVLNNITAIARGMGSAEMGVLDTLALERVQLTTVSGERLPPLPLTPDFATKRHIPGGVIPDGSVDLYPLGANLDKSVLYAFAYAFPSGFSGSPRPCSASELESQSFMPSPTLSQTMRVSTGDRLVLTVGTPRVLVIWSVAFCKERADFEPGAILGAGRIYPHVMVMCNVPIREVAVDVRFKRPERLQMRGEHDHDAMKVMNHDLESSLFLDGNDGKNLAGLPLDFLDRIATSPYWSDLFDAYKLGVGAGTTIRAVDPKERGGTVMGAIERLKREPHPTNDLTFVPPPRPAYVPDDIRRVPRQGAFDNLHCAPTMRSDAEPKGHPYFLERVYMAPFCEHDCFHLHWRWGAWHDKKQALGFSAGSSANGTVLGTPHAEAGAPMVPDNQFVDIEMKGKTEWLYRARALGMGPSAPDEPIPAGTFSFFLHHGGAYALALVGEGKVHGLELALSVIAIANLEPLSSHSPLDPALRYWRLRYGGESPRNVMERLRIVSEAAVMQRTP